MRPAPTRCVRPVPASRADAERLPAACCSAHAMELTACGGRFEATVRQGPSAGLALVGQLEVRVEPSGQARAVLTLRDGATLPATGHVNGQAINLIFVVRQDTYLFGVGTSQRAFHECAGLWGGPFVGPEQGDIGDWLGTQIRPVF